MKRKNLSISRTHWQERDAYEVSNGVVRLVALTGGGHVAEMSLAGEPQGVSPLWVAPWKTIEPYTYQARRHASRYGSIT